MKEEDKQSIRDLQDFRDRELKDKTLWSRILLMTNSMRTTEYGMLISFVGVVIIAIITWFSIHLVKIYQMVSASMSH